MMSFLAEIEAFSRRSLRKTDTNVTREDGRVFIERRDQFGKSTFISTDGSTAGFVVDVKPDLQVGRILPGLLLGYWALILGSTDLFCLFT